MADTALPVTTVETCQIDRWRGYVTSRFVVPIRDQVLIESGAFRSRGAAPPPQTAKSRSAYDEVVAALVSRGWEVDGSAGSEWYATRFLRTVEITQAEPPQEQAAVVDRTATASRRPPAVFPEAPEEPPAPAQHAPVPPEPVALEPGPVAPATGPPAGRAPKRTWLRRLVFVAVLVVAGGGVGRFLVAAHHGGGQTAQVHRVAKPVGKLPAPPRPAAAPKHHSAAAPRHHSAPVPAVKVSAPRISAARIPATPQPTAVPKVRKLVLQVDAVSGPSWVEIRQESATGPILFNGNLPEGRGVHYRAPQLWATFGAASHLSITVDGRRIAAFGTVTHTFTATQRP